MKLHTLTRFLFGIYIGKQISSEPRISFRLLVRSKVVCTRLHSVFNSTEKEQILLRAKATCWPLFELKIHSNAW